MFIRWRLDVDARLGNLEIALGTNSQGIQIFFK